MGVTKAILDWVEKETNKIDESTKHPYLKAFGLGAVEGVIDGAVFMYPILVGTLYYIGYKNKKNQNGKA